MTEISISTAHLPPKNTRLVFFSLLCTYMVFAILLNSVGTVILQSIETFGISKTQASVLEGFKDLPIAIVSFFVASALPRFGFKNALLTGLGIVTFTCLLMPMVSSFLMTKLLFLSVGVSFALTKVSVYAMLGHISRSSKQHASNMNTLEGCFMLGVLSGYWIFSGFIDPQNPSSAQWLNVYWLLSGISFLALLITAFTSFPDTRPENSDTHSKQPNTDFSEGFIAMLKLALLPFVIMFVVCAFFYVVIEQGVGTWLPTFNKDVVGLSNQLSVQITSVFAACLAIGRLSAGMILRRLDWFPFLIACVLAMAVLLLLVIPMTANLSGEQINSWQSVPFAAFLLPLIGLFMAPIYPAINSVVLSALPKEQHASMTGLIVIFSALGGTLGSLTTGIIFDSFDGQTAFYFMLLPMAILLASLFMFKRLLK